MDEELVWNHHTSSVSREAAATFPHWGRLEVETTFAAVGQSPQLADIPTSFKAQRVECFKGLVQATSTAGGHDSLLCGFLVALDFSAVPLWGDE